MSVDFRLPNITATTPEGQIQQLNSYLYQLVNQLSWAFNNMEAGTLSSATNPATEAVASPRQVFSSIKHLIRDDKDIPDAYLKELTPDLDNSYLTLGRFEQYSEETANAIEDVIKYEQMTSSDVSWQKRTADGGTELWGKVAEKAYAKDAEITIPLPQSMTVMGVHLSAICPTHGAAYISAYSNSSLTVRFSIDCTAELMIYIFGMGG